MLLGFDPPTSSTQIQKFQKTVVVVVSSHFSPGNRGWGKPQKSRPSEPYDNKNTFKKKHHKRPSFETAPCQYSCDLAILAWAHPRPSTSKSTPGKVSQCKGSFHRSTQNDVLWFLFKNVAIPCLYGLWWTNDPRILTKRYVSASFWLIAQP